ncbi:hypothetical protein [Novosphingobium sp. Leaf2]|uniref:hypothetical protein n=1 Tax=Novosphingobium sp. Leaf2 TaxID=1735670 RepID=UPI0006F6A0AA|nr:hypothetical protein [Novosphingobium sp. Leaf2]KQM13840.1 hypothetical protein ASE49_12365 [Novosphingobium sp. Leaf2]
MGEIVKFPYAVEVERKVRHAQRMITFHEERIENGGGGGEALLKARLSESMLPDYQADLRKALAEKAFFDAGSVLQFNGRAYAEMAGRA